ncbi:DUF3331 domain-containing protein [Paraburkholderia sediminicola]
MHSETHLKQRTDTVHQEARAVHEALCPPRGNVAVVLDGGAPVWEHMIVRLLASYRCEGEGEAYLKPRAKCIASNAPSRHVQVEVIERLSQTSIAVLWQDSTRCRYVDQVWISCRARHKGCCALSGATIRRDDPIYKPRVRSAIPANADAMILASVIARMSPMAMNGDPR